MIFCIKGLGLARQQAARILKEKVTKHMNFPLYTSSMSDYNVSFGLEPLCASQLPGHPYCLGLAHDAGSALA